MDQLARTPKQLGAALRRRRRAARLSQVELGARTGMRQATISALENGNSNARLSTLMDAMMALGLEIVVRERRKDGPSIEDIF